MKALNKALALALFGIGFGASAQAADIMEAPIGQAPLVPVEIGSAWYLRGDVSYDFKSDLDVGYRTYGQTGYQNGQPTYGYGGRDHDGFEIDDSANFGAGFGYQFTDYFRGDLTANYWKADVNGSDERAGGYDCAGIALAGAICSSEDQAELTAWELMANAYLDLGTFAGFTPYVGGGLGAVHVDYDGVGSTARCDVNGIDCGSGSFSHDGEKDWRFAYALMAGVSYDLTQSLKLDVGYRYVNVDDGNMFGWDSASAGLGATGIQAKDDGFDRHTIQAGLRYSLF